MLSQRTGDILNRREVLAICTVFTNAGLQDSEQLLRFTFTSYIVEVTLTREGKVLVVEHDMQSGRTLNEEHADVMAFVRAYS